MNNNEAKFILQSYRHTGADADDPVLAEALEHAKRDPELSKWLEQETQLDAEISRKLKAVPIPANLRENILAGGKIVKPAVQWNTSWLAAAAAIVVLLSAGGIWWHNSSTPKFETFRSAMIDRSQQMTEHVTFKSSDLAGIREWFAEHNMKSDLALPAALESETVHGCRVVDWNGEKVGFVCFMLDGKEHADLFVMDRARFRGFTPSGKPSFEERDGYVAATWKQGKRVYLLAAKGDRSLLEKYL
ncbi:MAG: hypothetical protein ABIQ35_05490 [Verrucomicrobiota bacterium]